MAQANRIAVVDSRKETPVERGLALWRSFHSRDDLSLGWRGRSTMIMGDGCADSEQLYDRMDSAVGEAMDAIINGMKPQFAWALKKANGISRVWNFPSLNFEVVMVDALIELENKMQKNIATRSFFN